MLNCRNAKILAQPLDTAEMICQYFGIYGLMPVGVQAFREGDAMTKDTESEAGAKVVVEDVKGKAKEILGEVTGDEEKAQEGRAQQRKAEAEREAATFEAQAEAARAEAVAHEAEQRSRQ